jgi:putative transposase
MNTNPPTPSRKSPRLKDYDYTRNGAYFITICTQNRACLFGSIREGEMYLNPASEMLGEWWRKLPEKFSTVAESRSRYSGIVRGT